MEADETYVGGKEGNKHKDKRGGRIGKVGKTIVMGVLQREGELRAGVIDDTTARTVERVLSYHVASGSTVITDDAAGYRRLQRQGNFSHHVIRHSAGEYVRDGHIHTNSMESCGRS